MGDTARRLSFVGSVLILAGLLAWSAHETAPARSPANSGAPALVALPPLARAAAPPPVEPTTPVVPATPVTLTH